MTELDATIRRLFQVRTTESPHNAIGTREKLARLFRDFGYTTGAEIGVARAVFSRIILQVNPQLETLLCIDHWQTYHRRPNERITRTSYVIARQRLSRFGTRATIIKKTSHEAAESLPAESLDFVYIDADHKLILDDLRLWAPKVRVGGIIAGHDYVSSERHNVVADVKKYTHENDIDPWYVTKSKAERIPSWFWVQRKDAT